MTSTAVPRGGISKDERRPDNVALHSLAVNLAITATRELLEDIREAVGPNEFLRYLISLYRRCCWTQLFTLNSLSIAVYSCSDWLGSPALLLCALWSTPLAVWATT